jgi:hypothetical protein
MPTLESLGIVISALSLILVALNFKKLREVDMSVVLVPSLQDGRGFPVNVEICIENISNNFIPYAQATIIKIYVDNNVEETKSEIMSIKKGIAKFINIDFLHIF